MRLSWGRGAQMRREARRGSRTAVFSCSNRFQQLGFFRSKIGHALSTNLRKELPTLSKDPHQQTNLTSTANKQDEAFGTRDALG